MTDPMELVGRLETHDGAHERGCEGRNMACTCGDDERGQSLLTEAAACIRDMVEWRPIASAPDSPCMGVVAFFSPACADWINLSVGRDERYEMAWFDGTDWRESGTAHLFDERDPDYRPTHWLQIHPRDGGAESVGVNQADQQEGGV